MIRMRSSARSGRNAIWAVIAALLLAPLVAMQFTAEVRWTASDFFAAAALLFGAMAAYEVATHVFRGSLGRVLAGGALTGAVLLIWAEGAVGLF